MPHPHATRFYSDGTPAISQGYFGDFDLTYNPDDGRWYVYSRDTGLVVGRFADRRNAIQYMRTHTTSRPWQFAPA